MLNINIALSMYVALIFNTMRRNMLRWFGMYNIIKRLILMLLKMLVRSFGIKRFS